MQRFRSIFQNIKCVSIGMIHVDALPGTPRYGHSFENTVEKAKFEANIYLQHKLDAVLIENMHDIPYVQDSSLGPETTACMTRIATEVKKILTKTPCGIQILACGNSQALALAKATDLQFIRAEGFVFGHVADEGYTDACAGELLRYRKTIDAENVLVWTDIKKKHSSHSITADTSLLDTAHAAEFFLSDGIIITGNSTGSETSLDDLNQLHNKINIPLLIGSGVTTSNLENYLNKADGVIVGSHFKKEGNWKNEICEKAVKTFMEKLINLRETSK